MSKSARWALGVSAVAVLGAALVLAFVLSLSTSGWLAERHFVWLFWVNVAVAGLLALVIGLGAARLATRLKRGKFGSRLLAKLAGVFALVGVVPGLLIYGVSYQFVTRSIDTWFDVQVAQALDAGLSLGRSTLDAAVADLSTQARTAAERLADARQLDARGPEGKQPIGPLALERTRQQLGVRDAVLLGANGQVLASAGGSNAALVPERPAAALLRQARLQRSVGVLEGLDDEPQAGARATARVRAVALVPNTDINLAAANEERFLMLVQPLPDALVANALAVQAAYREYQQRALARDGLRRMVVGTLTLSLVLSVFGALLLAVSLGNQIIRPLLLVADGVRQVAEGDLTAKPVFASRDELGGLTRSFAQMTEQLSDARAQVQRGVAQLEGARTRLQTILDSLSAGVIVFDRQGAIDTVNPGATRILRQPLSAYRGRPLADVPGLAAFSAAVWQRSELHRTSPEDGERDHWQDAFELQLGNGESLNLLLRGASLPGDARLLVFDDITHLIQAQRDAAWGEGISLVLDRAQIAGALCLAGLQAPLQGASFTGARAKVLVDDASTWGERVVLDGFAYSRFGDGAPVDSGFRLAWLERQPSAHLGEDFRIQPWRRVIRVLRGMGRGSSAGTLALRREQRLRRIGRIGRRRHRLGRRGQLVVHLGLPGGARWTSGAGLLRGRSGGHRATTSIVQGRARLRPFPRAARSAPTRLRPAREAPRGAPGLPVRAPSPAARRASRRWRGRRGRWRWPAWPARAATAGAPSPAGPAGAARSAPARRPRRATSRPCPWPGCRRSSPPASARARDRGAPAAGPRAPACRRPARAR